MPFYTYKCQSCGNTEQRWLIPSKRHKQTCMCGGKLTMTYGPVSRSWKCDKGGQP